jgi:hypothetical protein
MMESIGCSFVEALDDPSKKTYYFVFAPQGTTLPEMVKAIGERLAC